MSINWAYVDDDDNDDDEVTELPAVDVIMERWLAGEDVSEWEDDGTIAEIKEDADELE